MQHTSSTDASSLVVPLAHLAERLRGTLLRPGDADYDEARTPFYGGFDRYPAAIARVVDAEDVARVVRFAADHGLELAVRSGGHSLAAQSVSDGGIVIDLARMKALEIDVDNKTAWAEAGLTAEEFTKRVGVHGFAVGFGDTGTVGIGGITLGGGVGYLSRKYGLTIDSLLAADVVTADGQLRRADAESHPDLFWALRGGGGNFGVVTRFKFRLQPVERAYGGMLILPATAEVVTGFLEAAEAAPEDLSTIANIMVAPPMPFVPAEHHGKLIIMALMMFVGTPEDAQRALAPLRALATPLADMLRPVPYADIYPPEQPGYHPLGVSRTMFTDSFDRSRAERMLHELSTIKAMMAVAQLRVLGGAIARVTNDATAYAHRQRRIMVNVAALYQEPSDRQRLAEWVLSLSSVLAGDSVGAYVNFLGEDGAARMSEAYPAGTWERLVDVKSRYDPTNLFRLNQNIAPLNGGPVG